MGSGVRIILICFTLSLLYIGTIHVDFLCVFYVEAKSTTAKDLTEAGEGIWKSKRINTNTEV